MTVTYTRLMEAQSKRHPGVQMVARSFATAADLVDSIMERRARMNLQTAPAVLKRVLLAPAPPVAVPVLKPNIYVAPPRVRKPRPARRRRDVMLIQSDTSLDGPMLHWQRIIAETCLKHSVTRVEMESAARHIKVVAARHEAMFRLRHELGWSMPRIGRVLGDRDHTTVLNGIRKHTARLEAAPV